MNINCVEKKNIDFAKVLNWLEDYNSCCDNKSKESFEKLIVVECLSLVKKISKGLARRSSDPVDDIIQVGSLGLVKAIKSFNPNVSKNFKAYATYLITGEIKHYLRDKVAMIKPPREFMQLAYRITQLQHDFMLKYHKIPTDIEIAEQLQMSVQKVEYAKDVDRRKTVISLDPIFIEPGYSIRSSNIKNIELINENKIIIKQALEKLDRDLRDIIELIYLEDLSQREVARRLNISQMMVSRKLKKALEKLFIIIRGNNKEKE